jgi:hypothetical protein
VGIGETTLYSNTGGAYNAAVGVSALFSNTTGQQNTAIGFEALRSNTIGNANTATGYQALFNCTDGVGGNTASTNTADGNQALFSNTTGDGNTATGHQALFSNTTGAGNTATGLQAFYSNTAGVNNTADGVFALANNITGNQNIALGYAAGHSLTTGDNNIDIGSQGIADEANTIRIGTQGTQTATFIAGVSGATASGGSPVYVDANGQLGTIPSSQRFKQEIAPMDKISEAILALKPVTFRYKHEIDPKNTPQFGLVAEQVEKVDPDLVARDGQGKVYTVRYEAVNAMLLNEFLKEHRKVQELEKKVEKLTAGLQKVGNELELRKPAPRTASNNQ